MDLATLLAARHEALSSPPVADPAAAERDLLACAPSTPAWIEAAAGLVALHQRAGRAERAWPLLRSIEAALPGLDALGQARALAALGAQALLEIDAEVVLDRARRAAEAFDRAGEARAAGVERALLGAALLGLGDVDAAEQALLVAAGEREGLSLAATLARHHLARLHLRRGGLAEATPLAEVAARRSPIARATLAAALTALGQAEAAVVEARRALADLEDAPDRAVAMAALALALLALGRPGAAVDALAGARPADVGWLLGGPAPVWLALADARAAFGDPSGAAAALAEARRAVLAFAFKLKAPAVRRSYLEGIPEHRRALALDAR